MRLFNIKGRLVNKNVTKYLIDWDKKSASKPQWETKQFLAKYWKNHVGVYEEFPVFGSLLRIDFLNAQKRIAVETQGRQHSEFIPFFHNNSRVDYWKSIKRDSEKLLWLERNGYTLLEIEENEVKNLSLSWIKQTFGVSIV